MSESRYHVIRPPQTWPQGVPETEVVDARCGIRATRKFVRVSEPDARDLARLNDGEMCPDCFPHENDPVWISMKTS